MSLNLPVKAHSDLSASGASRWINCAGSVEAESGLPDVDSEYSKEGTAAHALAQVAWLRNRDPEKWLGDTIEEVVVSQEMVDGVRLYLDVIRKHAEGATRVWTEHRVDLSQLRPPVPMFATADFIAYHKEQHLLIVDDLKFGKGVIVIAKDNWQTLYYALGAWLELFKQNRSEAESVQTIRMHIIQPRVLDENDNPSVTEWEISLRELKEKGRYLMERARKTQVPNVGRVAGEWCRFCKAKPFCSTFRGKALSALQDEFSDIMEPMTPIPPDAMTREQLSKALTLIPMLREWASTVEGYALGELERGRAIPLFAIKPKRANRKWVDEDAVAKLIIEGLRVPAEELYDKKLKSPAQVEKLIGKKNMPLDLVSQESSGFTLCRDTDKAAIASAVDQFTALP